MKLSQLSKITEGRDTRVGRGKRGARGAKSGRGTKGLLKRGKTRLYFEGGSLPMTKRIPMLRGKAKNKSFRNAPVTLNLSDLENVRAGSKITVESLAQLGMIDVKHVAKNGLKILGNGKLTKKVSIDGIALSKSAKEKVEKVGGSVI